MIENFIRFIMSNFTLTFLVIGLVFSAVAIARAPRPRSGAVVVEKLISWFIFWTIGVLYTYNFIFHVFFGQMAAAFIGWSDSPFQLEVGMASLGCGVVGFYAAFRSLEVRVAAILSPAIFMLGAFVGHAYQIRLTHNMAPGNAGIMFYSDIILPLLGFVLLWAQWKAGRPEGGVK
ncbi:MAG: DUF6790 family protein [Pseudolabrys sp.]